MRKLLAIGLITLTGLAVTGCGTEVQSEAHCGFFGAPIFGLCL
jgi:hypothetical protein